MSGLARRFFGSAVLFAVLGMSLGLAMGISQDHGQMPTHAHLLLIGWVSFAIYGFFYHMFPAAAASRLAQAHFWIAEASLVVLVVGLAMIFGGRAAGGEPFAAAGSTGLLVSSVLFAVIAWPAVRGGR